MASTPAPSRRRPRRPSPAIYTLRVELDEVEPAIWRRFTVPSDLMLDALHPVLQTVMGWTDSHLHGFVSGEPGSQEAERFEVRSEFSEPLDSPFWDGMPPGFAPQAYEDEVRLDEVLAEAGDTLVYSYDFGDDWEHLVTLEGVEEKDTGIVLPPECLDGARACPPEDCGGVRGYWQLRHVLASPGHPEEQDLRHWLTTMTGRPDFDAEAFDAAAVNVALRTQAEVAALIQDGDTPLSTLLTRLPQSRAPELYGVLSAAGVGDGTGSLSAEMTGEEVERATLHLRWLLRVMGPDGLALTGAGYLPPKIVADGRAEFGWTERWRGVSNRESDHHQMLDLREAARGLGLTRKAKGMLLRTKLGNTLAENPSELLWHVAARLPLGKSELDHEAGLLLLIAAAAGQDSERRDVMIAQTVHALGWQFEGRTGMLSARDAGWLAEPTKRFLNAIGALGDPLAMRGQSSVPEWGRKLARMGLRS